MSDTKKAAELAEDYLENAVVPVGENTLYWKEGFYVGHASRDSEIENLKMVCRRLAAAKSIETRDKIAAQCMTLFAGEILRHRASNGGKG